MLFTSPDFLFAFLPGFLFCYFAAPSGWRNAILLCGSLAFYAATAGASTLVLLLSIGVNFLIARRIAEARPNGRGAWLWTGIVLNVLPLLYFKYVHFGLTLIAGGLGRIGIAATVPEVTPTLPIGISFFTFQAVSYIVDVYHARVRPAARLIDFGMYHACFPQVIAGPIVRYEDVEAQVRDRPPRLDDICNGAVQFCFGLAKKAMLADPAGVVCDTAFGLPDTPGFVSAWLGALAYGLQIYLDFSGYSDMAIGMGRMLGFHYPENFDQPYRARSVTEFWRRWHMTLSHWFRDYVYVPLGGNRGGLRRTLLNLWVVFFLCGLWHGAAATFVVWGLYHGALLVAERFLRRWVRWGVPGWLGWIWTIVAVLVGWVFFRAPSLGAAFAWLGAMARPDALPPAPLLGSVLTNDKLVLLALAAAVSLVPYRPFISFAAGRYRFGPAAACCSLALACAAVTMLSVESFTPFIYFRF